MKKIILSLVCLLTLCGCGKIPTLKNGEEAVITFKKGETEYKISANDLYEELKNSFGLEATINLIDNYVLENEFKDYIEEAKEQAKDYMLAMQESYGGETELLNAIMSYTNYTTIEAYEGYLYRNFLQNEAITKYVESLITDKEVEEHYKDEIKGDIEVYHILVTPEVVDGMTKDEIKKAEDEAKKIVEDIIDKLNKADNKLEEFKKLVKEHSKDDATNKKDGNLGYINYGVLSANYDELVDAAYKLKDGAHSKKLITTELGYHVIYRNASKEKEALKDIKDEIVETLANEKIQEDQTLSIEAMKYYRKLYNLEIIDSELNSQYGRYLNNLINSVNNTEEE